MSIAEKKRLFPLGALFLFLFFSARARSEEPSRRERRRWAAEAQSLLSRKNYDAAAQRLEEAVVPGAARGDLLAWWPLLGRCYEAAKNYQKALAAYQQAYQMRPKNVDRMLDLARVYGHVDLNAEALDLYQKVLVRDKRRQDVVFAMADLYFRSGQWESARESANLYLKREPQDLEAQKLLARSEESLGDLSSAAHRWEGVLALRPSAEGYFHLGQLWTRQGQFELAERAYEKAQNLGLSAPALSLERGLLAWRQGRREQAAQYWRAILQAQPHFTLVKFLLALNDYQMGKSAAATEGMRAVAAEGGSVFMKDMAKSFLAVVQNGSPGPNGGAEGKK